MNLSVLAVPWRGCQKKIAEKLLHNLTKRTRPIIKPFLKRQCLRSICQKKNAPHASKCLKFILSSSVPEHLFFKSCTKKILKDSLKNKTKKKTLKNSTKTSWNGRPEGRPAETGSQIFSKWCLKTLNNMFLTKFDDLGHFRPKN